MPRSFKPNRPLVSAEPFDTGAFDDAAAAVAPEPVFVTRSEKLCAGIERILREVNDPPETLDLDPRKPGNMTLSEVRRDFVRPDAPTTRFEEGHVATADVVARFKNLRVVRSTAFPGIHDVKVGDTLIAQLAEKPDDRMCALLLQSFEAGIRRALRSQEKHAGDVHLATRAYLNAVGVVNAEAI